MKNDLLAATTLAALAPTGCAAASGPMSGDVPVTDASADIGGRDIATDAPNAVDVAMYDAQPCGFGADAPLCRNGQICITCSAGPMQWNFCATPCTTGGDCTDPVQSNCIRGGCNFAQYCASESS